MEKTTSIHSPKFFSFVHLQNNKKSVDERFITTYRLKMNSFSSKRTMSPLDELQQTFSIKTMLTLRRKKKPYSTTILSAKKSLNQNCKSMSKQRPTLGITRLSGEQKK